MKIVVFLLYLLPKNFISWLTGVMTRIRCPGPVQTLVNKAFVGTFGINMLEAENAVASYPSIEDLFVRHLKPGARPIVGPVVSPSDGELARSLPAENYTAMQAKGFTYRLDELVWGGLAPAYDQRLTWFTTVYLAPHNYHRVHAPMAGRIKSLRYIPGELWPVNATFVHLVPRIFTRNERLVFEMEATDGSGGRFYVVMVGAFNVGRMEAKALPGFVSNDIGAGLHPDKQLHVFAEPQAVAAGDELGTFLLGSTVVVVFDDVLASRHRLVQTCENRPILMGQSLLAE